MAWDDRDYYRSRESGGEYLGNPALFFGFSLPFGRWFGVPVRLSFWLLLTLLFMVIDILRGANAGMVVIEAALLIAMLLVHDFSHRLFAQRVGGSLDEFLLWPAGGLIHPTAPPAPLPTFIAHAGGIIGNFFVGALCAIGLIALHAGRLLQDPAMYNPLATQFGMLRSLSNPFAFPMTFLLWTVLQINIGLILVNLLPFYWFDGGYLLESILWPWLNRFRAINVTCIAGMCIAAPMLLFSLYGMNLFGMVYWALLFASSFSKRRELKAGGEESFAYSAAAYESDRPTWARRKSARTARGAARAMATARREQEKIDAILAKVHASGMQSLTWSERRTLSKATERQRRK